MHFIIRAFGIVILVSRGWGSFIFIVSWNLINAGGLNVVVDSIVVIVLVRNGLFCICFVDVLEMFDGCCDPFDVARLPDAFCLQIQQPVSVTGMVIHIADEHTVLAMIC